MNKKLLDKEFGGLHVLSWTTLFLAKISAVETNIKTNLCDPLLLVKFSIFLVEIFNHYIVSIKTVFIHL